MAEKNSNMEIYNAGRAVEAEALRPIKGGKLVGMSDINPMWRIKKLTEIFGVCGIGWKYEITKQWLETWGTDVAAFCNINLYVKVDGEWSEAIPGTGGSSFATQITKYSKPYNDVSDECYKMALTDAISVACKALGLAADVYFSKDRTKYDRQEEIAAAKNPKDAQSVDPEVQLDAATTAIEAVKNVKSRKEFEDMYRAYVKLMGDPKVKSAFEEMSKKYPKP